METDEKNWSWKYLKDQITKKGLDDLYEKYCFRIRQSSFTVGLLIIILFSVIRILTVTILTKHGDTELTVIFYATTCGLCAIFLLTVCLLNDQHTSKWTWYIISIAILVFIELSDYVFIFDNWTISHTSRLAPTFIHLLITYNFLPFPHPYAAATLGLVLALVELLFSGLIFYAWQAEDYGERYLAGPISADLLFLITCNLLGIYKLYLNEVNQRRAFLDHRLCIESQVEYNLEKERAEKLMLSILPKYIASQVMADVREQLKESHEAIKTSVNPIYIEKHQNVSILFSDMVNSVELTSNLTSHELVKLLNELFGKFDEIATANGCERLRILGDCYIAMCGIPDYVPDHAKNCVKMGFKMIETIRLIREDKRVNVEMRIGVHSGKVMSGMLGVRKCQYDIWSSDVEIAHILESSGSPGRVHISKQTKDLLGDGYFYEENVASGENEYLSKRGVTTYFIVLPEDLNEDTGYYSDEHDARDRVYVVNHRRTNTASPAYSLRHFSIRNNRRRPSPTKSLHISIPIANGHHHLTEFQNGACRDVDQQINEEINKAINDMPLNKREQWFHNDMINPMLLTFRNPHFEMRFLRQFDPLFKYYLLAVLLIFVALYAINSLTTMSRSFFAFVPYVVLMFPLLGLVYLAWHDYVINVKKDSMDSNSSSSSTVALPPPPPRGRINSLLTSWSRDVGDSLYIRITIWAASAIILSFLVLFNLGLCIFWDTMQCRSENPITFNATDQPRIENPRFYTYSVALVMTSIAAFLRIHFVLKLALYSVLLVAFHLVLAFISNEFIYESFLPANFIINEYPADQSVYIIMVALSHHLIDRQFEYLLRLDYLWKRLLVEKREESDLTNIVSKFLLRNIVPVHVAEHFLNEENTSMFYSEDHSNVAVMFANIPNFSEFYDETSFNEDGLKCLRVLDEIICELDSLLMRPQFKRVEKIKVISSTYMAAAGLCPHRRNSSEEDLEPFDSTTVVTTMVNLAFSMMDVLEGINKINLQEFQFRIGIDCGPLSAGVVGAQRPIYDIWGDPVNTASRMETTGEMGKIQVTADIAQILMKANYSCQYRGKVFVKGKGYLETYFVTNSAHRSQLNSQSSVEEIFSTNF